MNDFIIISFSEAEFLISKENLSIWKQDEYNLSIIYKRKDNTLLCLPIKGDKAVIFSNFEIMENYFKNSGIPIPSNNLFALAQTDINNWENNIELIERYEIILNCKIVFPLNKTDIINLDRSINYYYNSVLKFCINSDFFIVLLAIIGNQLISVNDKIKWVYRKDYDINQISIPTLIYKDNEYLISAFLIRNIRKRKIDFVNIFEQIYSSYKLEYTKN